MKAEIFYYWSGSNNHSFCEIYRMYVISFVFNLLFKRLDWWICYACFIAEPLFAIIFILMSLSLVYGEECCFDHFSDIFDLWEFFYDFCRCGKFCTAIHLKNYLTWLFFTLLNTENEYKFTVFNFLSLWRASFTNS